MLWGREAQQDEIGGLLDRARRGAGGALWFVGEPGVGKSALLEEAATVWDGGPVLSTAGREAEIDLAWAGLGELLGPLLDEGLVAGLEEPERSTLLGVLARGELDGPVEPYAVLRGASGLVAAAAARTPLLVLVDDVQWLDAPSRLAVEYLVTHVADLPVALLVAGRPDEPRPSPVPTRELDELAPETGDRLVESFGISSPAVRAHLIDHLGGNPLLLRAAAEALSPGQRRGADPLPAVFPVPPSVLRLADQRLAGLDPGERSALLVLALAPRLGQDELVRVLGRVGVDAGVVTALERAGLVEVREGVVRFSHPSVRTAAFQAADGAARRDAHAAVAAEVTDPATRAWHLGLARAGPDASVASDLGAQAARLLQRGAPMLAARYLELAARLSVDVDRAARRLRLAAEAASEAGEDDTAMALVDRAGVTASADADERWRRERLRLRLELRTGEVEVPVAALRGLADEVAPDDPGSAAEILLEAIPPLVRTVRLGEVAEVAERARCLAGSAGDARLERRAEVALGVAETAIGDPAGEAHLARHREVLAEEGVAAGAFLAEVVAPSLAVLRPGPEADALFEELDTELRARAAAPALIALLAARAIATQTRRFPEAVAYAGEAVELSQAIGRPVLGRLPAISLVLAAGLIGDRPACETAAALLLDADEPLLVQGALIGLGALGLSTGELDEALVTYERIRDELGLGQGVTRWEPEWCEVLVRLGRTEEAIAALGAAKETETAWLAEGPFARVQGMLAETPDAADEAFDAAVSWFQLVGNRMGEGRTHLCWGERARRDRRRGAARRHLERALELFEAVGAGVWVDRTRRELDAVVAAASGQVSGVEALSNRELDVARRAAAGATNPEIAQALFLSRRTVETHLGAALRKLGVANRRELAALAADDPRLREPG